MAIDEATLAIFKNLYRLILEMRLELAAYQMALVEKGVVRRPDLERHRQALRADAQPALDLVQEADGDSILEMLRKFEGPLQ